jgi:hypothetical protein
MLSSPALQNQHDEQICVSLCLKSAYKKPTMDSCLSFHSLSSRKNDQRGCYALLLCGLQNWLIICTRSLLVRVSQKIRGSHIMSVFASVLSKTSTATGQYASRCFKTIGKRKHGFPLSLPLKTLMGWFMAARFSKLGTADMMCVPVCLTR